MNTYGYVGGNPLKYIDPTGELFFLIPGIPVAAAAIGDMALAASIAWGLSSSMNNSIDDGSSDSDSSDSDEVTELFPSISNSKSDDFCKRRQQELMGERNLLEDFEYEILNSGYDKDPATSRDLNNAMSNYNREASDHNKICRTCRVPRIIMPRPWR